MNLRQAPLSPEDEDFIYRLYASTRMAEIAGFGWDQAQQEAFLRMQFNAQKRWYEMAYPGAEHTMIFRDEQPVGRMIVLRGAQEFHLIDIALLPEHRGCGIGTALVAGLIAESQRAAVPLALQVLKSNRAVHLYQRLGFIRTGEDEMYYQMRANPA